MTGNSRLSDVALELLRRVKAEGGEDALLAELQGTDIFEMIPPLESGEAGTMTDASKRRLVDQQSMGSVERQIPITPSKSVAAFPPGVPSLEMWGQTILAAGKFASDELAFVELFKSDVEAHRKYRDWLWTQRSRSDFSAPLMDFIEYMKAMKQNDSVTYFPDSTTVRRFKKVG